MSTAIQYPNNPIAKNELLQKVPNLHQQIFEALRPQLKAPLTAVLCEDSEMGVVSDANGYTIRGTVNSQNSYGAMIASDFVVKGKFYGPNDFRIITATVTTPTPKTSVGCAKGFGIALMVISGIVDAISIGVIESGGSISTLTIISSVAFGIGLLITFLG